MRNVILKKLTLTAILSAFAIISFVIEGLLPPLFIPGARMGISNIFVLLALILLGKSYAFSVLLIKILLGSVFSGNVSQMMYSLPSGAITLLIEILLFHFSDKFSIIAISTLGAIINSTIQNIVFCLITTSFGFMVYLPYLALISVLSGLIIGSIVFFMVKHLPKDIINLEE